MKDSLKSKAQEDVIAIWRRAAKGTAQRAVVVVLHGRGADEHDLMPVIDRLPRELTYVSLRGFVPAEGGFTWFENRGPARPTAAGIRASVTTLRAWLDVAVPAPLRCYALGFSAGMMMAGALLLAEPQRFAGAVLLSGALALDSGLPAETGRLRDIPIFYGRGTLDEVIPAALVTRSEEYLRERSGALVSLHEYSHGHVIALREIHDIAAWLRERA